MGIRCVPTRHVAVAVIAVATSMVTSMSAIADDYPVCERSIKWPDECIVGGYRHYGEIYFSRPVRRGAAVSELPRGEQIGITSYDYSTAPRSLDDFFARSRTSGMIVLKDGKIVFERYMLGADEHTLFHSASIAKSVTSTLVGFAIGDALIRSVDDPISDYIPALKGTAYDGVPIKAVLQMSSGVGWVEEYGTLYSDAGRMSNESIILNTTPITEFVLGVKRRNDPFAAFSYKAVDPVAIGWLVSHVTGKNLSDYLSEKLWIPLGMEADANWVTDGDGPTASEAIMCCFNATLREYARFGLLMAQNGVWQGKQLLPATWVKEATQPDRPQVGHGKLYSGYKLGYQYYWWTFPGEDRAFEGQGIRGQFLYVNPSQNLVIVMVNAWPKYWDDSLEIETYAVFDALEAALRH
jgi:CubicO group peptidase (beta-lactamase class C family)